MISLVRDAIYVGDNGRLLHGRCSGASAQYTGRDISGQRVQRLSAAELVALRAEFGRDRTMCEYCDARAERRDGPTG